MTFRNARLTRYPSIFILLIAFFACLECNSMWQEISKGMEFVSCEQFIATNATTDNELCKAVVQSFNSLSTFDNAFRTRKRSQTAFTVVCCAPIENALVPIGIEVQRISELGYNGKAFLNRRNKIYWIEEEVFCPRSAVIDWRYSQAFELVGGTAYCALLKRLGDFSKVHLTAKCPFYIPSVRSPYAESPIDPQYFQLMRFLLDEETAGLERILLRSPQLFQSRVSLPFSGNLPESFAILFAERTVAEFAASECTESTLEWLEGSGLLNEDDDEPLIKYAIISNNIAAVKYFLKNDRLGDASWGFVNSLCCALSFNRIEIAKLLIQNRNKRFEPNAQDRQRLVKSVISLEALKLLHQNGYADSESMLKTEKYHLAHQSEIDASLFAEFRGAKTLSEYYKSLFEVRKQERNSLANQALKAADPLQTNDLDAMLAADYGLVLPVEFFRLP